MNISIKRDKLTLRGVLQKPRKKAFPLVIFFHGFGGSIEDAPEGVFTKMFESCLSSSIGVLRFDFNGHGKSDGDFSDMNMFNLINDAIAIIQYASSLSFVQDIYLIGHSQGGVVAGMVAGLFPDKIKKLILLAPAASLKEDALRGRCFKAQYDTNHIPPVIDVDGVHKVGGHYFRIAKNLPIYEFTSKFTNPTLVIYGKEDFVVSALSVLKYSTLMPCCNAVELNINHGLFGKDSSLMLEKIADFLTSDTILQYKEILNIDVKITSADTVKSSQTLRLVSFSASSSSDYFMGKTVSDGVDMQKTEGDKTLLSARYILKGTDYTGTPCSIFIENNTSDGFIVPHILTDSPSLKFLEKTRLISEITPTDEGVRVSIKQKL